MADRRDSHQRGLDDELEHGWTGGLEIEVADERPSTGLGHDPGARKWILGGVGASCLLTAAFVLLATHDVTPAHAAAIEAPPEPSSELDPPPSEGSPTAQPSSKADSTLAAGSSAAVHTKPRAAVTPKPAPTAAKPAATPKLAATSTPAPKPALPASKPVPPALNKPAPTAPKPAAAPVAPDEIPKLPSEPAPASPNGELPDVEPWDEADDEASSADATVPATPS